MSDASLPLTPLEKLLADGIPVCVAPDGQILVEALPQCPPAPVILPGSFNPVHHGHWRLARTAERRTNRAVVFELSVVNVDKPPLTLAEIRRRVAPFQWQAAVWLTRSARFAEKAERFPGATFVVGADTALRVVSPAYYDNDVGRMRASLERIQSLGCRFLVACRVDAVGKCWRLHDLAIPGVFLEMFDEIPPEEFRWDVSSTQLRTRSP